MKVGDRIRVTRGLSRHKRGRVHSVPGPDNDLRGTIVVVLDDETVLYGIPECFAPAQHDRQERGEE